MKARFAIIAMTALAVPLSFIETPYPKELVLQHAPTLVGLTALAFVTATSRPSLLSFSCVIAFLWLHIVGARWIYSFVPYDILLHRLTGATTSELFDWQRNHYDRLVHLGSGLLGVPPMSEILQRHCGMLPRHAALMAVSAVLATGAVYEIFEWLLAITVAPAYAEAYNGQQGDAWDPQKDLALACVGAMISAILVGRWRPASHSN